MTFMGEDATPKRPGIFTLVGIWSGGCLKIDYKVAGVFNFQAFNFWMCNSNSWDVRILTSTFSSYSEWQYHNIALLKLSQPLGRGIFSGIYGLRFMDFHVI